MKPDPDYRAYLLRLWRARNDGDSWRASLEDAHTRELHVFADMTDVFTYLETQVISPAAEDGGAGSAPAVTEGKDKQPERSSHMWMDMITLKTNPENVAEVEAIMRQCCGNLDREHWGREVYRIHSADEPGTVVSMTIWDNPEQQEQMLGDEHCARLVEEELMPLLLEPLKRAGFYVLAHTICEACEEF